MRRGQYHAHSICTISHTRPRPAILTAHADSIPVPSSIYNVGYLQIASNEERVHEMRRLAPFMNRHGIDIHEISPGEAQGLFPIEDLSDALSPFYTPGAA